MLNQRLRKRLIVTLVLLFLSIILAVFAYLTPYFPGDIRVAQLIQRLNSPSLTSFMIFVSAGFTGIPSILLAIALVLIIWWRLGLVAAIFMAADGVLSPAANLFKFIIERPRPPDSLVNILVPVAGLSFPSGHAFFATMILGMPIYFVLKYVSSRPLKVSLVSFLVIVILLVGYSRVYLGDHWPSDVIGSYFIGSTLVLLLTMFYEQRIASKPDAGRRPEHS
ncbi:MAG TPA: phosphatase PAP2 family protein [Dehalococcoidales bacterium]